MTTKPSKTLLLSGREDQAWAKHLRTAVEFLDKELVVATETAINDLSWSDYDLVILDAGAISDVPEVILQVRRRNPATHIIVFSSSPTWEQARETMLAGAVDYSPKVFEHTRILEVIRRALSKQVHKTQKHD